MKKYLLPKDGHFYKANLHMHTTVSDGNMTPEQTKEEYLKHGYSIVNFSDHEVPMSHADLYDENFLALTSCEISLEYPSYDKNNNIIEVPFAEKRVCHMNLISPVSEPASYPYFCKDALVVDRSAKYIENAAGVVEATFDINDLLVTNIKYIAINLYGFDGAVARTMAYRHNELI